MTTWTPFTVDVVKNALPSDMGQLYANWITAHPEKANRLAEIVDETRRTFRDAVSTNPRTLMDPETDTVPTVAFRHALNVLYFNLGMEMGAQLGPDAHSQYLRADLWLRMVQTGGIPMPVDADLRGGTPSFSEPAGRDPRRQRSFCRGRAAIFGMCLAAALGLAGNTWAGWLSPSQTGFTPDETLQRIAGDRVNALALAGATDDLWRALDGHNHDGRYDPAGAAAAVSNDLWQALGAHNHDGRYDLFGTANAVSNGLQQALAGEAATRAAFDDELQGVNGLVLYGHDLYRETIVNSAPGWLDWQVSEIDGQPTVWVWAHWEDVILNADGSLDDDQSPDFWASDFGQYAWILDPDGNYRVPQEWQDGDHFDNVGPDNAVACSWNGWQWCLGETTVDDTVIDAVDTGYTGSDYLGSYDDNAECAIDWQVSDDRKQASYTINWQPSANAPQWSPWYQYADSVQAMIRIRPAANDAFVWDGGVVGDLCAPDGTVLAWLGNGSIDPPVEMSAGFFFGYTCTDWYPNTYGATPVYLDSQWLYGFERRMVWFQVPSAYETTNIAQTVVAPLADRVTTVEGVAAGAAATAAAAATLDALTNDFLILRGDTTTLPVQYYETFDEYGTGQTWTASVYSTPDGSYYYNASAAGTIFGGGQYPDSSPAHLGLAGGYVGNVLNDSYWIAPSMRYGVGAVSYIARLRSSASGWSRSLTTEYSTDGLTWIIASSNLMSAAVGIINVTAAVNTKVPTLVRIHGLSDTGTDKNNNSLVWVDKVTITYPPAQVLTNIEAIGEVLEQGGANRLFGSNAAPMIEGFESNWVRYGTTPNFYATNLVTGWHTYGYWAFSENVLLWPGPFFPNSGTNSATVPATVNPWIASPVCSNGIGSVSFLMRNRYSDGSGLGTGVMQVQISTNNEASWSTVQSILIPAGNPPPIVTNTTVINTSVPAQVRLYVLSMVYGWSVSQAIIDNISITPYVPQRLATINDIGREMELAERGPDNSVNTFAFGGARAVGNAAVRTNLSLRINVNGTWYDVPVATVTP